MGSITFSFPCGDKNFSRGYCAGFSAHTGCDNFRRVGDEILFDVAGIVFYTLRITTEFLAPTTNTYSVSFVFDAPNCWIRDAFGTPIFAGMIPGIVYVSDDHSYRVAMDCTLPQNPLKKIDIPAPAYVWQPPLKT